MISGSLSVRTKPACRCFFVALRRSGLEKALHTDGVPVSPKTDVIGTAAGFGVCVYALYSTQL